MMVFRPEDEDALRRELSQLDGRKLEELGRRLRDLAGDMSRLNSLFPATRQFLEDRGLTDVSQLDARGRQELMAHLRAMLKKLAC